MKSYFLTVMVIASFGAQAALTKSMDDVCYQIGSTAEMFALFGSLNLRSPVESVKNDKESPQWAKDLIMYGYNEGKRIGKNITGEQNEDIKVSVYIECLTVIESKL